MNNQLNKHKIIRLWLIQLSLTALIAAGYAVTVSYNAATSALLGGLVCIIPNACFAVKLFKYKGAQAARQIVQNFYKGEALKIIISIFLFTAVFVLCRITPLAFFVSYILIQMTHWFSPLIISNKEKRQVKWLK
ncbi:MAG: ATP synthase subunit I [Legionella sp.]|nr:ATP synthase subunit I [Legionella sp.]